MIPYDTTGAVLLRAIPFLETPFVYAGRVSRTTGAGVAKARRKRKVRNRIASKSRARNRK